jgi:hypothetical protein
LDLAEKNSLKDSDLFQTYLNKLLSGLIVEKDSVLVKEIFGDKVKIHVLNHSENDKKIKITNQINIKIKGIQVKNSD